jgi:hypothetical protein
MTEVIRNVFLYVVLVPSTIAGVAILVAWQPWRDETWLGGYWGGSIAIGAGYAAAHVLNNGDPKHMPYLIAGIVVLGLAQPLLRKLGGGARWVFRITVPYGIVLATIGFMFSETQWSGLEAILWLDVSMIAIAGMEATLEHVAEEHPGATAPLAMIVLASGASGVLVVAGTARMSELMGALAGIGGVLLVSSWWDSSLSLARGGATVFTLIFAAIFITGFFSLFGPPYWAAVALAVAPQFAWFGEFGPIAELEGWLGTAVRTALFVPPLALAVFLAGGDDTEGGGAYGELESPPTYERKYPTHETNRSLPAFEGSDTNSNRSQTS